MICDFPKTSGIYSITCGSKCYYGRSVNLFSRLRKHQRHLARGSHHNMILQRAFNKYGITSIQIEVICPRPFLEEAEQIFLDYRANCNFMSSSGGITPGNKLQLSPETRNFFSSKEVCKVLKGTHNFQTPDSRERVSKWNSQRSGKLSPTYDHTEYNLLNLETGEHFIGTKQEFQLAYGYPQPRVASFLKYNKHQYNGWIIL